MTSPHASTAEDIAATTTAGVNESPLTDLTAAAHTEVSSPQLHHDQVNQTISQEESEERNVGGEEEQMHAQNEQAQVTIPAEAAIPDSGDIGEQSQFAFPPVSMAELQQMSPWDALTAFAQPMAPYNHGINGMRLPPVSADTLPALDMVDGPVLHHPLLDPSPYIHQVDETRVSAYAKLEFEDGEFYMNTYSVILGRDLTAARAAMRRDAEKEKQRLEDEVSALVPETPVRVRREESRYSKSVVSESGGILREGNDSDSDERARRRKGRKASKKSKSTGSSSQHISRRNSLVQPNGLITYQPQAQARRSAPNTAGAVPVDPASLRPSPHDCPLVAIHPAATEPASVYKTISREHVKIGYNSKKHLFEAEIIGRNGAFVDDLFHHHGHIIPLKSGSQLQIGPVVVRFVLPDVAIGETGAEHMSDYDEEIPMDRYSEGGKEMSFDFEDEPRDETLLEDTSEEPSPAAVGYDDARESGEEGVEGEEEQEDEDEEDEEDEDDGEEESEEVDEDDEIENGEGLRNVGGEDEEEEGDDNDDDDDEDEEEEERDDVDETPPEPVTKPQKKRGPGRPPKNGVMSKREQQVAKKEAQQRAKKTVPQGSTAGKNKVGRPRKHPRPETPPIPREKRKYTKRKPKEPRDPNAKQEGDSDDKPAKEKKEKKPPKPPRSPSPQFNEADLTPEQLAKPAANYVTLIHEALSNSPNGQMSLPQIYRAIQRKYPFFVLRCNTNGWQSSVRHNLSQHHAFRKVQRDGKGWMWGLVDGVSIEKEKKRRATPPPQMYPHMHHPIYPHMMAGHIGYGPGMMGPPQGYPPINAQMSPNVYPGQVPQFMPGPPHMNGHPVQSGTHALMNSQQLPVPAQGTGPNGQTYSSPYAPKQPPTTTPQHDNPQPPGDDRSSALIQPSGTTVQQPPSNSPQGSLQANDHINLLVEKFKTNLIKSLKEKSDNADEVVASAVNRVLGVTTQSTVPGDPHEDMIMNALRDMLSKIPGSNIRPSHPPSSNASRPQEPQNQSLQRAPQSQANNNGSQNNIAQPSTKLVGAEKPGPPIMRPSFTGQGHNRPSGPSVPRPPMVTPGMKRTDSGSPANVPPRTTTTSSASPAPNPPNATNGGSAPKLPGNETGPIAGQKRPLDDADDMRDFKRLSTSGPPRLKT